MILPPGPHRVPILSSHLGRGWGCHQGVQTSMSGFSFSCSKTLTAWFLAKRKHSAGAALVGIAGQGSGLGLNVFLRLHYPGLN